VEGGGLVLCNLEDAVKARDALDTITSGTVVISVVKPPYKCPPVPYEWAFVIHDLLTTRGVRDQYVLFTSA
jgi:sulfide:quinone oxidoreductase